MVGRGPRGGALPLAALACWHALDVASARSAAASLCAQRSRELDCESEVGCYWGTWRAVPECLARPLSNGDCWCTIASGCGDPFMNGFVNSSWDGPSGCQPTRFCRFRLTTCQVQLDLSSDSACAEDGQNTMKCVPGEFCTTRQGASTYNLTFTNLDCVLKPQGSFTPFPTPQPTPYVPPPSPAPTPKTAAPSPASMDSASSGSVLLLPLAAGAGLAVAVGVLVIAGFSYRRRRGEDTAQVAATAMAVNAVRTAAQMQREEEHEEELQRNAGAGRPPPQQQQLRRDRDDSQVPDF
jgi:hypothetical protein